MKIDGAMAKAAAALDEQIAECRANEIQIRENCQPSTEQFEAAMRDLDTY